MSNLSNSMGAGGGGGGPSHGFTDTGYGTHDGQGNVPTGAPFKKGTGYDKHGQVSTSFGKWPVSYDAVTGMAVDNTTAGYDFPAGEGGADVAGGLVDVSASAQGHATSALPELQQQVQDFFAACERQQQPGQGQGEAPQGQGQPSSAGATAPEETGQGVAERLDASAFLTGNPELAGHEAERRRNRHD